MSDYDRCLPIAASCGPNININILAELISFSTINLYYAPRLKTQLVGSCVLVAWVKLCTVVLRCSYVCINGSY